MRREMVSLISLDNVLNIRFHLCQITKWDDELCQRIGTNADLTFLPQAPLYLLTLIYLIMSLKSYFSPKQQLRFPNWEEQLTKRFGSQCNHATLLTKLRRSFLEFNPFADMQLSSFQLSGVKQSHLHPSNKNQNKKKPTAAQAASSTSAPDDVLFTFLPRGPCSQCGRNQPFYCAYCFIVVHEMAKGKVRW